MSTIGGITPAGEKRSGKDKLDWTTISVDTFDNTWAKGCDLIYLTFKGGMRSFQLGLSIKDTQKFIDLLSTAQDRVSGKFAKYKSHTTTSG